MLHYWYEGMMCVLQSPCYLWFLLVTRWAGLKNYIEVKIQATNHLLMVYCVHKASNISCVMPCSVSVLITKWHSRCVNGLSATGKRFRELRSFCSSSVSWMVRLPLSHAVSVPWFAPNINPLWMPLPSSTCFLFLKTGKGVACGVGL